MLMNVYAGNGSGQGKAARTADQERPGIPRNPQRVVGSGAPRIVTRRGNRGTRTLQRRAGMPRN